MMFVEKVPFRFPESILDELREYFTDKQVYDLGCGSADTMVYIKEILKCKTIKGVNNNRHKINQIKYNLDILQEDIMNVSFDNEDTYFLWIETPDIEKYIIRKLEYSKRNINIIIAYNTKGSCTYNSNIPNDGKKFNDKCNNCKYLKCIENKIHQVQKLLIRHKLEYILKTYNYNNGILCRENGEVTLIIINIK